MLGLLRMPKQDILSIEHPGPNQSKFLEEKPVSA